MISLFLLSDSERNMPADEGMLAPEPQCSTAGPASEEISTETSHSGPYAEFPTGFLT